jgi:hypothetical protein
MMPNRVIPKRVFGGVKKRKESPLMRSIRESAEREAARVIAQPMAHEALPVEAVHEALAHPVREKVSDLIAVPFDEVEARKSRHGYHALEDWKDKELRKLYLKSEGASKVGGEPYVAPSPDALEYAAWYLAGVVCSFNQHHVPLPPWPYEFPCKLCFSWAIDSLHTLATHRIPTQELAHGSQKSAKKPVKKAR